MADFETVQPDGKGQVDETRDCEQGGGEAREEACMAWHSCVAYLLE